MGSVLVDISDLPNKPKGCETIQCCLQVLRETARNSYDQLLLIYPNELLFLVLAGDLIDSHARVRGKCFEPGRYCDVPAGEFHSISNDCERYIRRIHCVVVH